MEGPGPGGAYLLRRHAEVRGGAVTESTIASGRRSPSRTDPPGHLLLFTGKIIEVPESRRAPSEAAGRRSLPKWPTRTSCWPIGAAARSGRAPRITTPLCTEWPTTATTPEHRTCPPDGLRLWKKAEDGFLRFEGPGITESWVRMNPGHHRDGPSRTRRNRRKRPDRTAAPTPSPCQGEGR